MGLRNFFDSIEPHFLKGGKLERYFAVYEMVESFIYTPRSVTRAAPHARDDIDLKRVMSYVVVATFPCVLMALYNTGYQTNSAIASMGLSEVAGWRAWIINLLGIGFDPNNIFANLVHGALYFLPVYIVTLAAGGIVELIFAIVRGHEINEGFFVTSHAVCLDYACFHTAMDGGGLVSSSVY